MGSRLRVTAVIALALLNVATLGAGVAVARLMPARLALWRVPRVATAAPAGPGRVLAPAATGGSHPAGTTLATRLAPLLAAPPLGPRVGMIVTDPATGRVLYSRSATTAFTPASNAKLVTAEAALSVLGPRARFTTRVVRGTTSRSVVLVGGGDPTLAAGRPPASDYPQPATLESLAAATARWLRARGRSSVHLGYDTSLFTGPGMAPGWSTSYVTTGNVTPITSLEVDQGRLTRSGAPQDADIMSNYRPRTFHPSAEAAAAFASFLRARGIRVAAGPVAETVARGAATIASVRSPMLSAIVAWMLRESNNVIAEDLARQVALRTGEPASFSGAAAAVTRAVARLGVVGGIHLVDGSGLSPDDRITPAALAALVRLAVEPGHPDLRPLLAGLPVAGFSGTLAAGGSAFGNFGPAALGAVRAKTGNLTRVASLSGVADDASGQALVFSIMTDRIPAGQLNGAADAIDAIATALAGCGCR